MKTILSSVNPVNDLLVLYSQCSDVAKRRWLTLLKVRHPELYNSAPANFRRACWGLQEWVVALSDTSIDILLNTLSESMDGRAILEVAPSLASLQTARLQQLASDDWFFNMSEDEQKEYIEEHPHSKYAGHIGKTKQDFDTDTSTDADHNVNKVKANRVKSKRLANLQKVKQKLADEIDTLNDSMEKIDDKLEALHNKMKQKSGGKPGLVKRLIHRLSGSVRSLKTKRKDVKESLAEVRIKYKAVVKQIKLIKRGKA